MSTVTHLSIAEYDRMIAAGAFEPREQNRLELIYGELREMTPIGSEHEVIVDYLNEWSYHSLPKGRAWVRVQNSIGIPALDSAGTRFGLGCSPRLPPRPPDRSRRLARDRGLREHLAVRFGHKSRALRRRGHFRLLGGRCRRPLDRRPPRSRRRPLSQRANVPPIRRASPATNAQGYALSGHDMGFDIVIAGGDCRTRSDGQ